MGQRDIQAAFKGFIRLPRRRQNNVCVYSMFVCAVVTVSSRDITGFKVSFGCRETELKVK